MRGKEEGAKSRCLGCVSCCIVLAHSHFVGAQTNVRRGVRSGLKGRRCVSWCREGCKAHEGALNTTTSSRLT